MDSAKNEDDDKDKKPSTFSFTSEFATLPTRDSAKNEDDDTNNFNDKNDPDDKNNKKKKSHKKTTPTPLSITNFSTLFCMFVFDTDPTRPLLAECLNSGYDLSLEAGVLFDSTGSLPNYPSMVLRAELQHILISQAEATGPSTDDLYMSSSRQLIIKTITDSFTFSSDTSKAKGLFRSQHSLEQALTYVKRTKIQFFRVSIPILHLHIVDESGFLLSIVL